MAQVPGPYNLLTAPEARLFMGRCGILAPMDGTALVLAPGLYLTEHAKTAHGLVRGSERFDIVGVIDPAAAGKDAGLALDGNPRGIPIFESLEAGLKGAPRRPDTVIVGVAVAGGVMPPALRATLVDAAARGLHIINGLHDLASEMPDVVAAAARGKSRIVDVRRPRALRDLHFWTGAIRQVRAFRVAVLGTDCALGKRTTARLLVQALRAAGTTAEMIYTGQTGWMQGGRYGFVLDCTPNDFVSGELEHAIVSCDREATPQVIVIEGQSGLRNPSGPCGSELIVSGASQAVVLQHAPGRKHFKGLPAYPMVELEDEIALIEAYGTRVVAVTLNGDKLTPGGLAEAQQELQAGLGIEVFRPIETGVAGLATMIRDLANVARTSA